MDMNPASLTARLAAARAVHFACCLLIGGVWSFDRLVGVTTLPRWRRLAGALLLVATPLALVSGAAWFILVSADMSGVSIADAMHPDVLRMVWSHTRFGRAWQFHTAFCLAGAGAAVVWAHTRRGGWTALGLSAGLVGGLAWTGHACTGPAPVWHQAADVLHLLGSAVWPGGLLPLGLLLGATSRAPESLDPAAASRITRRFSTASLIVVAVLIATGIVNSYCLLGSPRALFTSGYGRVLLIKLGLFLPMLMLGALNLLVWKPRITASDPAAIRRLRRNVLLEAALGGGVVAVVGLLGLLEPVRS